MKLSTKSALQDVARAVAEGLENAGIRAVLTGGACAVIHTAGGYLSEDLDFVLQSTPSQQDLDDAMAEIGFKRRGDQYFHPETSFFVEFPTGPLGIGRDLEVKPVRRRFGNSKGAIRLLSATDSCRDRLSAFYHWNDRQSLDAAVRIGLRNRLDMKRIREWSESEGAPERFHEFVRELNRARANERRTS